jgi:deoxyribonuclease V
MSNKTGCGRYVATDVFYPADGGGRAAALVATDPTFGTVVAEHVTGLAEVAEYRPGRFVDRELPALRAVLADVDLDPTGRPGLGAYAHAQFDVPVIGVAKTAFRAATHAIEVRRGAARKPLYVTATGIPINVAASLVVHMAGPYRLPDALRRVDILTRAIKLTG